MMDFCLNILPFLKKYLSLSEITHTSIYFLYEGKIIDDLIQKYKVFVLYTYINTYATIIGMILREYDARRWNTEIY